MMTTTFSLAYLLAGVALAVFTGWLVLHKLRRQRMHNRPDAPISPPRGDTAPVEARRPD